MTWAAVDGRTILLLGAILIATLYALRATPRARAHPKPATGVRLDYLCSTCRAPSWRIYPDGADWWAAAFDPNLACDHCTEGATA